MHHCPLLTSIQETSDLPILKKIIVTALRVCHSIPANWSSSQSSGKVSDPNHPAGQLATSLSVCLAVWCSPSRLCRVCYLCIDAKTGTDPSSPWNSHLLFFIVSFPIPFTSLVSYDKSYVFHSVRSRCKLSNLHKNMPTQYRDSWRPLHSIKIFE